MKNIAVIYTGGTLGMELKAGNLVVANLDLNLLVGDKWLNDLDINITYIEQSPIDSATIRPEFYIDLARLLRDLTPRFDGFVILHGTDTMEYTASILAFLCLDLESKIILTGAQIPFFKLGSDARANILNSILWCINSNVTGVNIAFGKYLIRGVNSYKYSSTALNAFKNVADSFIGEINAKGDFEFDGAIIDRVASDTNAIKTNILPTLVSVCKRIATSSDLHLVHMVRISVFPNINEDDLISMAENADIIFIEAYASGTCPKMPKFMDFLHQKMAKNAKVILVSQAQHAGIFQSEYATNMQNALPKILSAKSMTFATAFAKALFLSLANIRDNEKWQEIWQTNLIGEFSTFDDFVD